MVRRVRAACELAPDGDYNTKGECESDDTLKCGWKFTCDAESAGFCKQVQSGGTWETADECRCVSCFPQRIHCCRGVQQSAVIWWEVRL